MGINCTGIAGCLRCVAGTPSQHKPTEQDAGNLPVLQVQKSARLALISHKGNYRSTVLFFFSYDCIANFEMQTVSVVSTPLLNDVENNTRKSCVRNLRRIGDVRTSSFPI